MLRVSGTRRWPPGSEILPCGRGDEGEVGRLGRRPTGTRPARQGFWTAYAPPATLPGRCSRSMGGSADRRDQSTPKSQIFPLAAPAISWVRTNPYSPGGSGCRGVRR